MSDARSKTTLAVAWLCHKPGLALLGKADLAPPARYNLPAVLLTILAVGTCWAQTASTPLTLTVFAIGHMGWGSFMVWWIRRSQAASEQPES